MDISKAIHFLDMNGLKSDQICRVVLCTPTPESGLLKIALMHSDSFKATSYEFDVKSRAMSEWEYEDYDKLAGNWSSVKYIDFHPVQSDFLSGIIEALKVYLSCGGFILSIQKNDAGETTCCTWISR